MDLIRAADAVWLRMLRMVAYGGVWGRMLAYGCVTDSFFPFAGSWMMSPPEALWFAAHRLEALEAEPKKARTVMGSLG